MFSIAIPASPARVVRLPDIDLVQRTCRDIIRELGGVAAQVDAHCIELHQAVNAVFSAANALEALVQAPWEVKRPLVLWLAEHQLDLTRARGARLGVSSSNSKNQEDPRVRDTNSNSSERAAQDGTPEGTEAAS